jgi:hypothetical protein
MWDLAQLPPAPALVYKLLDRGVQAVVCGGARCALHVHGRSAKTDPCGHSFALLSAQL